MLQGFFTQSSLSVFTTANCYYPSFIDEQSRGTDPWHFLARVRQQVAELGFKAKLCELKSQWTGVYQDFPEMNAQCSNQKLRARGA